ncbi:SLBB domain-containing protein [Hydrotalea sp.]|uniref:SLBB domain-containing protein n=1 Tax=Hydrotalea sp. TaxID=2881279 RepID=UPI003D0E67D9
MVQSYKQYFFRVCLLLGFALLSFYTQAQLPVDINQLSDQQLIQYVQQANLAGLTQDQLIAKAREKGLSDAQIAALQQRIQALNLGASTGGAAVNTTGTNSKRNAIPTYGPGYRDSIKGLQVFGTDLFSQDNLTFEPNLNIPTPANYILGAGDELVVDVYGYSETTKKLQVTPDGYVRYPNVGPLKVMGLTIEEARQKIKAALLKIYPGIAAGNTFVQVTLGQIRSIKVTMVGEINRPGTYSLPSLATIANALYVSGGPSKIGSLRHISLMRNGKQVVDFDFYDFLLKGDLSKNALLQDGDVISVAPYNLRVAIKGAVKKPAIYELGNTNNIAALLQYCGGFADIAYKARVRIQRFGEANREMLTIPAAQFQQFALASGDTVLVDSVANLYANRVLVGGAVYHPGNYGLNDMPTLQQLVKAVQPREDAYLTHAIIRRLDKDYQPSLLNFNVEDVLDGKYNIPLQREDSIYIYPLSEIREKYMVTITGEVNKPTQYPFAENMKVEDLILMAGGLKDGASLKQIEVSRRIRNANNGTDSNAYAIIKEINLTTDNLANDTANNISLEPFDIVSVRRSPLYKDQITVDVQGEVLYPGQYTVSANTERLSDVIKRAGGLKEDAFPAGAILIRNTYQQRTEADSTLINNKVNALEAQSGNALMATDAAGNIISGDSSKISRLEASITNAKKQVGIRLDEALANQGSVYNLLLEEGDIIKIPKQLQTVQSFGGVYVSQKVVYTKGLTFRKVIDQSGGFQQYASRKRSYVIYPNGEIRSTKHFLFFKAYPRIKPGSEVYVPIRKRTPANEIASTGAAFASIAGLIVSLVYLIKK